MFASGSWDVGRREGGRVVVAAGVEWMAVVVVVVCDEVGLRRGVSEAAWGWWYCCQSLLGVAVLACEELREGELWWCR